MQHICAPAGVEDMYGKISEMGLEEDDGILCSRTSPRSVSEMDAGVKHCNIIALQCMATREANGETKSAGLWIDNGWQVLSV